jgi:tetratricopeptide (TPR) repeat protein
VQGLLGPSRRVGRANLRDGRFPPCGAAFTFSAAYGAKSLAARRPCANGAAWTPAEGACYCLVDDCLFPTLMNDLAHAKASFDRAMALLRAGDTRSAAQICLAALEDFPDDPNLLSLLGAAYRKQQRFADAETVLRRVIERVPGYAKAHEELGRCCSWPGVRKRRASLWNGRSRSTIACSRPASS